MSGLEQHVRRYIRRRVDSALLIYRAQRLIKDTPGYPFAEHPEDNDARQARNTTVTDTARGVRITIHARGARFLEHGNDARGAVINGPLAIPLKPSARGTNRARRNQKGKSGQIVIGPDGRPYLAVQKVATYRGKHVLENSLRRAFIGRR